MDRMIRLIAAILIWAFVPVFACELIGEGDQIIPWDFVLNKEKPEIPFARALFDSTHSFDAVHYCLLIDIPLQSGYFSGEMRLTGVSKQSNLGEISLHMMHLTADSVKNDSGVVLGFSRTDSLINITLPHVYQSGDSFRVFVYYHDIAQQRGMYYYPRNYYTMAEPYDARWWFPCYDEPWDKATATIYITIIDTATSPHPDFGLGNVASNGDLSAIIYSELYTTYIWVENYPMPTYLFCANLIDTCTNWQIYIPNGPGDSLLCSYYVYREDSVAAAYDFANVPAMVNIYSNLFGPYPFEKYGMVAVEPFAYGGMEHQTMTTINRAWITGDRRNESGIAHELAHQWWGDMVTMSDFRHIWLNEGFATYAEALFSENFYGDSTYAQRVARFQEIYFYYDQVVGRFPLFDPVAYFNAAEYYKGALVLHMLRGIVGDNDFFGGLIQYGSLYRYGNASTDDFREVMESVSGQDLEYFFREWIYEQGYPEYRYAWNYTQSGGDYYVHINIAQIQQNAPVFTMPIQLKIETALGDTLVTINNSQQFQAYQLLVRGLPTNVVFDPDQWITKTVQQVNSIDDVNIRPDEYTLEQNYPNPFNERTVILFSMPNSEQIKLEIFDINGRLVRKLYEGASAFGHHLISWDGLTESGQNAAAGIYLYRLTSGTNSIVKKMTYLK